jgi:hypothetical protein
LLSFISPFYESPVNRFFTEKNLERIGRWGKNVTTMAR